MKPNSLPGPADRYLLYGPVDRDWEARLFSDETELRKLILDAALDEALARHFLSVEPAIRAVERRLKISRMLLRLAAGWMVAVTVGVAYWRLNRGGTEPPRTAVAKPTPTPDSFPPPSPTALPSLLPPPTAPEIAAAPSPHAEEEPPAPSQEALLPAAKEAPAAVAARVVRVRGNVLAQEGRVLAAGDVVAAGERIELGTDGDCLVRLPDESEVRLYSGSMVLFKAGPQDEIRLESGRLAAMVRPRPPARPFLLRTPHAWVTVRGTQFQLDVVPTETRVEVISGKIEFGAVASGHMANMAAGQRLRTDGQTLCSFESALPGVFYWRLRPATR